MVGTRKSAHPTIRIRRRRRGPLGRPVSRRGVASVLAMMFLVMFGSLSVAMAIASRGNLRTAETHLHVVRAMGAADTGMEIAARRLEEAVSRFVVSRGDVDEGFGRRLWTGTTISADGEIEVLAPPSGFAEGIAPSGIAEALVNVFGAEANVVPAAGLPASPFTHSAPPDADGDEYLLIDWVTTPAIAIDGDADDGTPAAYQITYAPLVNGTDVRVIVTGYSSLGASGSSYAGGWDAETGQNRPVTRLIQRDFRIVKRHRHAMVSASRIMIGKNVLINGTLGANYTDVEYNNGHPIVIRSDFAGLDPVLDAKLAALHDSLINYDTDGDNALRQGHVVEGNGASNSEDFDGDGSPDDAFDDATKDGLVDEFDIFINHYDADGDGRVTLSSALTAGTPANGLSPEFTADDDLALLLDSATPDRNGNGIAGFIDANDNGRWDAGEDFIDFDPVYGTFGDQQAGYRDGFIDHKDRYGKVNGRLQFRVASSDWTAEQGDYRQYIEGPIRPGDAQSAVTFSTDEDDLPEITSDSFVDSGTSLQAQVDGLPFWAQLSTQLGVGESELPAYTEANPDASAPRYWRADLDPAYVYSMTGRQIFEQMPFNSPSYSDWYFRPRIENMTFSNVQIPRGLNALFVNCTFVGVTWVRSYDDNSHENWSLYGRMVFDESAGVPVVAADPLDKSDFLRYETGNPIDGPENYDEFPEPPVIDGETKLGDERNTKLYSNNIRFHDCLFVGSLIGDVPQQYTHVRNKLQFTGGTRFVTEHPDEPENPDLNPDSAALEEINKSSLMMPNYSVDIGSFNSPTDTYEGGPTGQNVKLNGTIVAGILDIRGTASIDGTLLLTFKPQFGEGPLVQNGQPIGNPAGFNTTIGYFGPEDGDGESLDPNELPIVNGQRIVGWDTDGDGIADLPPGESPTPEQEAAGATAIPFYGFGRIELNWNPDAAMPDGIMLPISLRPLANTYREGRQ